MNTINHCNVLHMSTKEINEIQGGLILGGTGIAAICIAFTYFLGTSLVMAQHYEIID